jgi:hypothetical protein
LPQRGRIKGHGGRIALDWGEKERSVAKEAQSQGNGRIVAGGRRIVARKRSGIAAGEIRIAVERKKIS